MSSIIDQAGRTKLSWPDFQKKALEIKSKVPKGSRWSTAVKDQLGIGYWDGKEWKMESDGKGGIKRKSATAKKLNKIKQAVTRKENQDVSTRDLTKEEKKLNKEQEKERTERNRAGEEVEIDHDISLDLTGQTLKNLKDIKQRIRLREILDKRYGGIGNVPENRTIIPGVINGQKKKDEEAVQRHLGEKEKENPSDTSDEERYKDLVAAIKAFQSFKTAKDFLIHAKAFGKGAMQAYMGYRMLR